MTAAGGSVAALLAAAGTGTRLGKGPKALLEVAGLTLLERSAAVVAPQVDKLIVAAPPGAADEVARLLPTAIVVPGGASRQASVRAMLALSDDELVVVHDVARPFLPSDVLNRVLVAARRSGAATAALPVADTLVHLEGHTVDRNLLQAIQTPQAFNRELLLRAHEEAERTGREATDDAGLVRHLGHDVELVPGSAWLLKITGPDDLEIAEALVPSWDRHGSVSGADGRLKVQAGQELSDSREP